MAGETLSPNMNLPIPGVSVTDGPQWATDLNSSLTLVDAHDHTTGNGVAITPSAININGDLTFAGNSATNLLKASFRSQSAAITGTNFLSFIGGNLYANDGSGNQIPITSGGGVAGSPGSIGSLSSPASATYSAGSKLFTWQSGASKAAAMDNGAVTIRETDVTSAKGVTIKSATALAADYALTLFSGLPASTQYVSCDTSGNLGAVTSDTIVSAVSTAAPANNIAALRTRATGTTVGVGGVATSASSGFFTTTTQNSYIDVTNLTVTITTSGRPVALVLMGDNGSNASGFILAGNVSSSTASLTANIRFVSNVTSRIMDYGLLQNFFSNGAAVAPEWPAGIMAIDTGVSGLAGTYTYKIQVRYSSTSIFGSSMSVSYVSLCAYEL